MSTQPVPGVVGGEDSELIVGIFQGKSLELFVGRFDLEFDSGHLHHLFVCMILAPTTDMFDVTLTTGPVYCSL